MRPSSIRRGCWSVTAELGRLPLGRAIERASARLEGADHAAHRLVEEHFDEALQQTRAELEVDEEVDDAAAIGLRLEIPVIVEIAKRPLAVGDVDATRAIQHHARGEALAEHPE